MVDVVERVEQETPMWGSWPIPGSSAIAEFLMWSPDGEQWPAMIRCGQCNRRLFDLSPAYVSSSDLPELVNIERICPACGGLNYTYVTAEAGRPPRNATSGRWVCEHCERTGRTAFLGYIDEPRGRITVRCPKSGCKCETRIVVPAIWPILLETIISSRVPF